MKITERSQVILPDQYLRISQMWKVARRLNGNFVILEHIERTYACIMIIACETNCVEHVSMVNMVKDGKKNSHFNL